MPISESLRRQIRDRAQGLCEYCHSQERVCANRFTIEHVKPRSLGGLDHLNNLALACRRCNERRSNFLDGLDPVSGKLMPLFNPRQDRWIDHFAWATDSRVIVGLTPIGRATIQRLDMNDDRYPEDDSIRSARQLWQKIGIHPPNGDQ
jgi:hypothetical protein